MKLSFAELGWRCISGLDTQAYGVAFDGEIVRLLVGSGAYFIYFKGELIRLEGNFGGINYISRSQDKFFLLKRAPTSDKMGEITPITMIDNSGRVDSRMAISGPCSRIFVDSQSRLWVGYTDSGSLSIPEKGDVLSGSASESGGWDFPGVVCWSESGAVCWRMKDDSDYSDKFLHCHLISGHKGQVIAAIDQGNSLVSIDANGVIAAIETPILAPLGVAIKEENVAFLGKYELTRGVGGGYRNREVSIFEINGGSAVLRKVRSLDALGCEVPGTPRDVFSFENSIFMNFGDREKLYVMRID